MAEKAECKPQTPDDGEAVDKDNKARRDPIDLTGLIGKIVIALHNKNSKEQAEQFGFIIPSVGGGAKFVPLVNLMRDYQMIEDMALLHEIAVNDEFMLKKNETDLHKLMHGIFKKAFWENIRKDLSSEPPVIEGAITLLMDVKGAFRLLLTGNNDRALACIENFLDEKQIREKVKEDEKAVEVYINFIIQMMAHSCSKARDAAVVKLRNTEGLVERFRGIMELLDDMQLDMANYILNESRANIAKRAINYEKEKLEELTTGKDMAVTRAWLKRYYDSSSSTAAAAAAGGNSPNSANPNWLIIKAAYLPLVDPNENQQLPESFHFDKERISHMKLEILWLTICCGVTSIVFHGGQSFTEEQRKDLVNQLLILVTDCKTLEDMKNFMETLWMQVAANPGFKKAVKAGKIDEPAMRTEVLKLANADSHIFPVVKRKLLGFLGDQLEKDVNAPIVLGSILVEIPVALKDYFNEIISLAIRFRKVFGFNRAVWEEYYTKIIQSF